MPERLLGRMARGGDAPEPYVSERTCRPCLGTGVGDAWGVGCAVCGGTGEADPTASPVLRRTLVRENHDAATEAQLARLAHLVDRSDPTSADYSAGMEALRTPDVTAAVVHRCIEALMPLGERRQAVLWEYVAALRQRRLVRQAR